MKRFVAFDCLRAEDVNFTLGPERHGKPNIRAYWGADAADLALVSPACVTNWPRVTGDGNFGTMWGPTEISKSKYTIDLTDSPINETANPGFSVFEGLLTAIDDRLLDFVCANQLKILGRKNLSREECKMLQIRSVRPKYDKATGTLSGHNIQLSTPKFAWDGCGGRYSRTIPVCDHTGTVVQNGSVQPGDVVAVTMFANQVYTGVGGDKFGIHWSFEDVQVVCQRSRLAQKTSVPSFTANTYEFAQPYTEPVAAWSAGESQFSEGVAV